MTVCEEEQEAVPNSGRHAGRFKITEGGGESITGLGDWRKQLSRVYCVFLPPQFLRYSRSRLVGVVSTKTVAFYLVGSAFGHDQVLSFSFSRIIQHSICVVIFMSTFPWSAI